MNNKMNNQDAFLEGGDPTPKRKATLFSMRSCSICVGQSFILEASV